MPKDSYEEIFEEATKEDGGEVKTKAPEGDGEVTEETKTEEEKAPRLPKEGGDKPTYEEIEQKYKSLQGMIESQQKEKDEALKKTKELEEKLTAIDAIRDGKPKLEAEEKDADLEEYLKDYAYISANEAKLRKKELDKMKSDIISEISKAYEVPIQTVKEMVEENAEIKNAKHVESILAAHKDYGTDIKKEDIVQWAGTLSPTKKKANMLIITEGNTSEVIDLIAEYKEYKGIPIEKSDTTEHDGALVTKKDDRLESLEIVKGKKSPVTGGGKKKAEDFDSAFEEASAVK